MAYRYTNTEKWSDAWFTDLSSNEKLIFCYLCDICDTAGFVEIHLKKIEFDTKISLDDVKVAMKKLKKAYILSDDRKILFLWNFIKHQKNLPLRRDNNAHLGIYKRFDIYNSRFSKNLILEIHKDINLASNQGLFSLYGNDKGNIELDKEEIVNTEFERFWNLYDYKVGKKECLKKWNTLPTSKRRKIFEILPTWKLQFNEKAFKPHPITFLTGERWNDEISMREVKEVKSVNGVTKQINF